MTRARAAGDAGLLIETDGPAGALAAAIRTQRLPGVLDAIAGARTVLVITEPGSWDPGTLAGQVTAAPAAAAAPAAQAVTEMPVRYDGPDLAEVARLAGLTADEVIGRHAASEYTVGWLGFCPGFPYLTGLDPVLDVPRLDMPRTRVPRGSVAIAGGLAAVYPTESPGGWRLLGRTTAVLWDPARDPPALLAPGMRVRFRPVDQLPGAPWLAGPAELPPAARLAPHQPQAPLATPGLHDPGDFPAVVTERARGPWTPPAGPAAPAVIEVIRPGPLATVQDLGRPALGHLGVPASGAADAASLRRANQLAGNPPGAAGLEFTLGKAVLRFAGPAVAAVTGAAVPVTLAAAPGQQARAIEFGTAFGVPAGAELRIGTPAAGLRTYLAVRGGVDVPAVLGSRSADLLSRLGPPPLRAGDLLRVGPAGPAAADSPSPAAGAVTGPGALAPGPGAPARLRVLAGPRDDWFAGDAIGVLVAADYTVRPASDRTGLRLDGPVLARDGDRELPSEGMVTGALQVPPDGRPILLLADHPVTGGYPVIAVVVSADIGLAAQMRPGQRVRFSLSR